MTTELHNLTESLSVLGKGSRLSLTQRQKVRDQLFKKIGQATLLEAVQTQTDVEDLIMPVSRIKSIFQPQRVNLALPFTFALMAFVFVGSLATGAFAQDAVPGEGLYPVRKTIEALQIALTPDPAAKAQLKLSIATNRVQDTISAGPVAGPRLEAVLTESRKAIGDAKIAVAALHDTDEGTTKELVDKLTAVITAQRSILDDIAASKAGDDKLHQSVLAVRDDLDQLLPAIAVATDGKTVGDPAKPTTGATAVIKPADAAKPDDSKAVSGWITLTGSLTSVYGSPALKTDDKIYLLLNTPVDLTTYIGQGGVLVVGSVSEYGLVVRKVTINNKLIGETPSDGAVSDKNDNQLSRVEGAPN